MFNKFIILFTLLSALASAQSSVSVVSEKINAKTNGFTKLYTLQTAVTSGSVEYEIIVQNGNGLDYFQALCSGNLLQKIICGVENIAKNIFVKIDRATDLEVKINNIILVNRSLFPAEKGQYSVRRFLSGAQALNLYLKGLPTSSVTLKVNRFTIPNQVPIPNFTFASSDFVEPSTVSFSALLSSDPDGTISNYAWDFGDQSFSQGAVVQHTYLNAGTYAAKLTVTDNRGAQETLIQNVIIQRDVTGPILSNLNPMNHFEASANNVILTGLSNENLSQVSVQVDSEAPVIATLQNLKIFLPTYLY